MMSGFSAASLTSRPWLLKGLQQIFGHPTFPHVARHRSPGRH